MPFMLQFSKAELQSMYTGKIDRNASKIANEKTLLADILPVLADLLDKVAKINELTKMAFTGIVDIRAVMTTDSEEVLQRGREFTMAYNSKMSSMKGAQGAQGPVGCRGEQGSTGPVEFKTLDDVIRYLKDRKGSHEYTIKSLEEEKTLAELYCNHIADEAVQLTVREFRDLDLLQRDED